MLIRNNFNINFSAQIDMDEWKFTVDDRAKKE